MEIKVYVAGKSLGGLSPADGTITSRLILNYTPTNSLHIVTKQYAENVLSTKVTNATNYISGTLPQERLPAFGGDVTSSTGAATLTLNDSGVIDGTYTKVTVNTKGIVTSADNLSASDIPNLDWSKITTGKPTTLSGYGITDALSTSGGTITGVLASSATPATTGDIVTKSYVDNIFSTTIFGLNVGAVILVPSNTAPSGYLRCNGAELSKTTYSSLYSVVGDQFSFTTHPGAGKPWKQQYDINTQQSGNITGWTTAPSLPSILVGSQAIVTKNKVYLLGGYSNNQATSTVYTAPFKGGLNDYSQYYN